MGGASEVVIEGLQHQRQCLAARAITAVFGASRLWSDEVDKERDVRNDRAAAAHRTRCRSRRWSWGRWRIRSTTADTDHRSEICAATWTGHGASYVVVSCCRISVRRILKGGTSSSISEAPVERMSPAAQVVIAIVIHREEDRSVGRAITAGQRTGGRRVVVVDEQVDVRIDDPASARCRCRCGRRRGGWRRRRRSADRHQLRQLNACLRVVRNGARRGVLARGGIRVSGRYSAAGGAISEVPDKRVWTAGEVVTAARAVVRLCCECQVFVWRASRECVAGTRRIVEIDEDVQIRAGWNHCRARRRCHCDDLVFRRCAR